MLKRLLLTSMLTSTMYSQRAFAAAGWKIDETTKMIVTDGNGNPIYVQADGTETSLDSGTVGRLNGESKQHRERAEAAELKLKAFEGIDPVKAKKDAELVSNIDQKKLIDSGEIDKVRSEIEKGFAAQLADANGKATALETTLNETNLKYAFSSSKFVGEKIAVPPDMFQSVFGRQFKFEDGKMVPYDAHGNKIYSKTRMGETADVDEALEQMVAAYPHKDSILKGANQGGSGNQGGGGDRNNLRAMRRADFEKLQPMEQAQYAQTVAKGEAKLID